METTMSSGCPRQVFTYNERFLPLPQLVSDNDGRVESIFCVFLSTKLDRTCRSDDLSRQQRTHDAGKRGRW